MKRSIRVLAVVAPAIGLACWVGFNDLNLTGARSAPNARIADADDGRTRALPATGPVAAPDSPTDMMMPIERVNQLMGPHRALLEDHARDTRS